MTKAPCGALFTVLQFVTGPVAVRVRFTAGRSACSAIGGAYLQPNIAPPAKRVKDAVRFDYFTHVVLLNLSTKKAPQKWGANGV